MTGADPLVLSAASGRTVAGLLSAGASAHPDRELLVFEDIDVGGTSYSWTQVLGQAQRMAHYLRANGLEPGGRLHLHLGNRPEFLFAWFGCALLGASIVPSNVESSVDELSYVLAHSGARLTLTEEAGRARIEEAAAALADRHAVLVREGKGWLDGPAGAARAGNLHDPAVGSGTDLGLLYTSGTTARPKGVRVTHANYLYAGEVLARNLRLTAADRVLTVLPLFHANAQYYTVMGALVSGATIVLASRFSASRFMDQVLRHRVTVASLFAAPIRMILAQEPAPHWRAHSLRAVAFAQNLTGQELERWERAIGAPLVQLYGMTETMGTPVMNPLSDDRRPNSIGRVSVGYLCRVLRDDGTAAQVGETGQLQVHGIPGETLMRGYLDDPEATQAVLRDGWLQTGDVVRVESDGFLAFVDRRKDMIKRGGENVAASEVEEVLRGHPAVGEAAVFGAPDPVLDEQVIAAVVAAPDQPDPDPDELIEWCAGRLAKFRVPSEVLLLDELPRTAVGKVQRNVLATRFRERVGRTA